MNFQLLKCEKTIDKDIHKGFQPRDVKSLTVNARNYESNLKRVIYVYAKEKYISRLNGREDITYCNTYPLSGPRVNTPLMGLTES